MVIWWKPLLATIISRKKVHLLKCLETEVLVKLFVYTRRQDCYTIGHWIWYVFRYVRLARNRMVRVEVILCSKRSISKIVKCTKRGDRCRHECYGEISGSALLSCITTSWSERTRKQMFSVFLWQQKIRKYIPSYAALCQHVNRAAYQAGNIWGHSLKAIILFQVIRSGVWTI